MTSGNSNPHPFPNLRAHLSPDWRSRFIELQLQRLDGGHLSNEDATFASQFDLLDLAFPEFLEEALLDYCVPATGEVQLAVAAASSASALDDVAKAIQNGEDVVTLEIAGRKLEVLRISLSESLVEPIFHDECRFIVRRRDGTEVEITRSGGVYVGFEDLKSMLLAFDSVAKTIRLL